LDPLDAGQYLSFVVRLKKRDGERGFVGHIVLADGRELDVHDATYVVRVWVEPGGDRVRGTLSHAATREALHFQTSGRAGAIVRDYLIAYPSLAPPGAPEITGGQAMSESIIVSANVVIPNGPAFALSRTLAVDAYDKIDVAVPNGAADLEVEIQPGAAGQVRFLLVTASQYGASLSYKVNSSASLAVHALDEPHVLIGAGSVNMLDPAPTRLFLSNTLGSDAQVQILVGRDATP